MKAIELHLPKVNFDKRTISDGTEIRILFQELIQKLIKLKIGEKSLLEDIRFLIFDYMDNYESVLSEIEEEYDEYL